ncbi:hypothetical protein FB446DRAFT_190580 [Lentinula raphanica]|nr:hypothetical protein FB446DRAFT_190580 [Lentinula raphanica]
MFLRAISLVSIIGATFVSAQDPDPPQIWEQLKPWPEKEYRDWLNWQVQINTYEHRDWLYRPEKCPGYDQNELRFRTDGTSAIGKLVLAERKVELPGEHSMGVFDVKEPVPKRLRDEDKAHVLKVVDISDKSASCEPYALEQFGVWHRTGIRRGKGEDGTIVDYGGIYLRTEPGKDIRENKKWAKASEKQRLAYLEEVRAKVGGIVYDLFGRSTYKLIPGDFGPANVLLKTRFRKGTEQEQEIFPSKTTLIDFGGNGILMGLAQPSSESVFEEWFNRRFKLLWGILYSWCGDPSILNEFAEWYLKEQEQKQKSVQRLAH